MVDDWFFEPWLGEHVARHAKAGLPPLGSPAGDAEYEGWRSNFVRRGVHDYDVATEASKALMGENLRHSSLHFPRLLELATEVYAARRLALSAGLDPDSLDAAQLASARCEHCGNGTKGAGMVTVYHPEPDAARKIPATVAAHCVCPAGRWLRKTLGGKDAAILRRIPDLADVLEGRSYYVAFPLVPFDESGRFAGRHTPAAMLAALKSLAHSHRAARRLPERPAPFTAGRAPVPDDPILAREPAFAPVLHGTPPDHPGPATP